VQALQFAYWVNIVVLGPIAISTVFRLFPTDQARLEESAGWRVLAGAFWVSVVVLSILGLFQPLRYSPVLLFQVIYKVVWLAVYVAPRLLRGESDAVPWIMTAAFVAYVVVWPFIIPWAYVLGLSQ